MEGEAVADGARGRVQVFARCRPDGLQDGFGSAVEANEEAKALKVTNGSDTVDRVLSGQAAEAALAATEAKEYAFDGIFAPSAAQRDVFMQVGLPVLRECLKGVNGTILAYGQTGSGKTHSLLHQGQKSDDAGLLPRLVASLFVLAAQDSGSVYEIEAAAAQVYNEQVDDLLHGDHQAGGGQNLQVQNGGSVPGLTWLKCKRPTDMLDAFVRARANVVYAETKMNKASSRSHAIFQVRITKRKRATEATQGSQRMECTQARLNVIDLAGSERVKKSGVEGAQFKEATNINKSLLAFGNVVSALATKQKHVPLRDSKLTRILDGSIGGNCKTSLLVCVSSAAENAAETINTLEFASRAMRVEVEARVNTFMIDVSAKALFADLSNDVECLGGIPLGAELEALRRQTSAAAEKARLDGQRHEKAQAEAEAQQKLLQQAKADAEQKGRKWQEEAENLRQSQQSTIAEAARLKAAIAEAEKGATEWKERAESRAKEVEQVKKAAEKEVEQVKKAAGKEAEQLRRAVADAERGVGEWRAKAEASAKEAAGLKVAQAKHETTSVERHKGELKTVRQQHEEELSALRLGSEEASKRAVAAESRAEAAEGAVAEARARISSVEQELEGFREEVRRQREAAAEQTAAERRRAAAALQAAAAEADGLRESMEEAARQCEALGAELAVCTEELRARTEALDKATAALEDFRKEADERECRLREELRSQLAASSEAHGAEVARLEAELARACAEATATLSEERAAHAARAEAIEAQLAGETARFAEERARLEATHAEAAEAQRQEFESRLRAGKEQFEVQLTELEATYRVERESLQKRLDERQAELEQTEAQWRETKEQAVRDAWEEGSMQQRRLAAAFKAARTISTMKEVGLKQEHDELSKRFANRESRQEDLEVLARQKRMLEEQGRHLSDHERAVQGLALELQNRDATDRIFGGTGAAKRYRPASRGPPPSVLPGKKLGDLKNHGERRRAMSQTSSLDGRPAMVDLPPTAKALLSATVSVR